MKKPPNFREEKTAEGSGTRRDRGSIFLERFLLLLALADWPRFYLLFWAPSLTVGLDVGGAISTGVEIVVGLSEFSSWKMLTSLRRCWMAEAGS